MYFCQKLRLIIVIHIEHFTFNAFQTCCCVIWDEAGNCAFTDPGFSSEAERDKIMDLVSVKGLKPVCIMLTHSHFDHILGVAELAAHFGGIPVYMHPEDRFTLENNDFFVRNYGVPMPAAFETTDIAEGDTVKVGELEFEVIFTPGHSRGGVCYLERTCKVLISGDTLFAGAIGRSDHPGGDYDALMKSILEKLMVLDGDITVIPGHGPCTDIATEGMTNPFLLPFNEPFED